MNELEIRVGRPANGWVSLSVAGEIDLSTVGRLEEAVEKVHGQDGDHVIVDLSETVFMDSTGLKCLLTSDRRFRDSDRSFVLLIRDGPVSRLLEVSGVGRGLRVVSDSSEVLDQERR